MHESEITFTVMDCNAPLDRFISEGKCEWEIECDGLYKVYKGGMYPALLEDVSCHYGTIYGLSLDFI